MTRGHPVTEAAANAATAPAPVGPRSFTLPTEQDYAQVLNLFRKWQRTTGDTAPIGQPARWVRGADGSRVFRWGYVDAQHLAIALSRTLNALPPYWIGRGPELDALRALAAGGAFEVRIPA